MDKGEQVIKMRRLALSKESYFSIDFFFMIKVSYLSLFVFNEHDVSPSVSQCSFVCAYISTMGL